MTEAIYLEVSEKTEAAKKAGRRVSVSGMLKFLGVSRSGYLAWLHHVPSDTEKRRKAVKAKIQDIYDDSKQNYGAPKITVELRKTGEVISERTVGTYMRQMGIRAQWSKPWTITTKDSDFSTELQNILDEQFNPDRPNAVWCSDITYIWTIDGFVYLTSVMDLFSRKIIAWTLSETLEVSYVIDTINKAKARRNIDQPLIIHSDYAEEKTMPKNLITSCILIIRIQFFGIVFRVSQARRLLSLYQRSSTAFRHRQLWEQTC
ncbi:Integrase core domain [uncultured Dorea sp.]|uniref:IS3 family transposase n=1 Tax=Dorea formicigenerans TaxID=39486 RepID=UPI0008232639|nr:IS3 family transposase [uncultured Dorea sp.]SCG98817.1 Integrase core domain [uncultured Dorea sp.]